MAEVEEDLDWKQSLVLNAMRRMRTAATMLDAQADRIAAAGQTVADVLAAGGIVLVCGNGGSAAAAQHFAAEFTGKLALDRRPMPAMALNVDTSAMTAIANDYSYDEVFSRQVEAFASVPAVLVGLSTSGGSKNVDRALRAAERHNIPTIVLTGMVNRLGGDVTVEIPLRETARVQEVHDLVLHEIAQIAERLMVPDLDDDSSADRFPFALSRADLEPFRDWMRRSGQQLTTTNGVFDLLHEGHVASLRDAKAWGDRLVVLVNSDESTTRLKGSARPIQPLAHRLRALERTSMVDHVVVMKDDDPISLLSELQPDVHCKGDEYRGAGLPEAEVVEANGGRVEFLEKYEGLSSSTLIARIRR